VTALGKANQDDIFARLEHLSIPEQSISHHDVKPFGVGKLPTEIQDDIFSYLSRDEVEPFL
jgi:hypothetical protein